MNRSQGKRAKKRKRDEGRKESKLEPRPSPIAGEQPEVGTPPDLELLNYLTIGFNTTNRYLEALAQNCAPGSLQPATPSLDTDMTGAPVAPIADLQASTLEPLEAVFVPRSDQPFVMHAHLPMLIKAASLASASSPDIKLVLLPKGAETKLSAALGIPRVGIIGLKKGAPAASPLVEFVKKHIPMVEIPWLAEAEAGVYLPVEINVIPTIAPIVKKRGGGTRELTKEA